MMGYSTHEVGEFTYVTLRTTKGYGCGHRIHESEFNEEFIVETVVASLNDWIIREL